MSLESVIENKPRELAHRCETCGVTKRSVITADNLRPTSSSSGPRLQVAIEEDVHATENIVLVSDKLDAVYYARVMAISPECKYVKPGDRVVFVRSVGVKIPVAGIGETRLIHEHEVLGVVVEATPFAGLRVMLTPFVKEHGTEMIEKIVQSLLKEVA